MGRSERGRVIWQAMQLLSVGLAVFLLFSGTNTLGDPGIGWHLRTGAEIWKNQAAPWSDPFGVSDNPWIHDQWLSDLLFHGAASVGRGAFRGLVVLLIVAAWLWLPLRSMARASESQPLALLFGVALTLGMGCLQWFERPVLFSFACFAAALAVCRVVQAGGGQRERLLLWLPPLFAVWANLHPGVFLGLVAVSILLCERVLLARSRVATAAFILSAAATLLTPYGWLLHRSAAKLITNRYFLELNWEWASPDAHQRLFLPFFVVVLLLFLAASRGAFRSMAAGELALVTVLLLMSLLQRRYIPFFSLAVGPMLVLAIGTLLPSLRSPRVGHAGAGWSWSVLPTMALLVGQGMVDRSVPTLSERFPIEEIATLTSGAYPSGKIFHSPDWGGFLIWSVWPRWAPSIDDRNQLLGAAPYEEFFAINAASSGWSERLEQLGYRYLLLDPSAPLAYAVSGSAGWAELVRGRRAVVFIRQ